MMNAFRKPTQVVIDGYEITGMVRNLTIEVQNPPIEFYPGVPVRTEPPRVFITIEMAGEIAVGWAQAREAAPPSPLPRAPLLLQAGDER